MRLVVTAKMGPGTFEAKFMPLAKVDHVSHVQVVRKKQGTSIPKLEYTVLPGICKFKVINFLITPIILYKEVMRQKADLILAYYFKPHFFFAYIVSKLSGVPYVLGQTGTTVQGLAKRRWAGLPIRHIVRNAFAMNAPGTNSREFWISMGVDPGKISLLHSTIDTDRFIPVSSNIVYDFIFVGRIAPVKRLDRLVEAARMIISRNPQLRICIVGDGPSKAEIEKLAEAAGMSSVFEFAGFQQNTHEWLTRSHAFVMTSESEGLPCALMEAMSSGLVCLVPDINNMQDIVKHGETGYLYKDQRITELAHYLQYILDHRSELDGLRAGAREMIIAEHSYQYAITMWEKLLEKRQMEIGKTR